MVDKVVVFITVRTVAFMGGLIIADIIHNII